MFMIKITSFCDAAEKYQLGLQDPAASAVEGMLFFHDYLILFLIFIATSVFWVLYQVLLKFSRNWSLESQKFTHANILEIIWTIIPAFLLILIGLPSFTLLYSLENINMNTNEMSLKIIGHQWYWSYEYLKPQINLFTNLEQNLYTENLSTDTNVAFESYLIAEDDLNLPGTFRLLETDKKVILPIQSSIRLLVTAADVLHSWSVPSFGIKIDACPGRISQGFLNIKRGGTFYGQCSEICGINHGFMPITVLGNLEQNLRADANITPLIIENRWTWGGLFPLKENEDKARLNGQPDYTDIGLVFSILVFVSCVAVIIIKNFGG